MNAHCREFQIALKVWALLLTSTLSAGANDLLIISSGPTSPHILRYNGSSGAFLGQFASFTTTGYSMTFGPDGNLYVGMSSNISRYDGQTGALLNVFVPNTILHATPMDMTFGPDGNLYVAQN